MSRSRHKQKKDLWVRETRSGLVKHYEFYFDFYVTFKDTKTDFYFYRCDTIAIHTFSSFNGS